MKKCMCKNPFILSIQEEIIEAIDEAFSVMAYRDYISFILFIGKADVVSGLKEKTGTNCVIDYQLDSIYDETRTDFYIRYLRRNYRQDGFFYKGDSGIDDMHIELMIYSHLWDSSYFLKSLMRIASIVSGYGYLWNPKIVWRYKDAFMKKKIIDPLLESGLKLGPLVNKYYDSSVRNAFAHSLYTINEERKQISIRPEKGIKTLSFEEFQSLFLHSVILMNKMENALEINHNEAAKKNMALTDVFSTPDGVRVQIIGEMIKIGKGVYPKFKMVQIIEE